MKKTLLALFMLGAASGACAQALPTVGTPVELLDRHLRAAVRYYDAYWVPLPGGPAGAYGYDRYERHDSAGLTWRTRRYVLASGQLVLEQFSVGEVPGYLEGPSREWYESGQLKEELTYHDHRIVGELRTFHPNGQRRRVQTYGAVTGTTFCFSAAGQTLPQCPPYQRFAQLIGEGPDPGRFQYLVQARYAAALPSGYRQPAPLVVYYAFRVDPAGQVRDARVLNAHPGWDPAAVPPALAAAILQAISQLAYATPATVEGEPTNDVVEGFVQTRRVRR